MLGYFASDGKWMIDARLYYNDVFPSDTIAFMIDSGAEKSTLSTQNARKLGIDVRSLQKTDIVGFGGGKCKARVLYCNFAFLVEIDKKPKYHIEPCHQLLIGEDKEYCHGNIIGLDILKRFNIFADVETGKITFTRIGGIPPRYMIIP